MVFCLFLFCFVLFLHMCESPCVSLTNCGMRLRNKINVRWAVDTQGEILHLGRMCVYVFTQFTIKYDTFDDFTKPQTPRLPFWTLRIKMLLAKTDMHMHISYMIIASTNKLMRQWTIWMTFHFRFNGPAFLVFYAMHGYICAKWFMCRRCFLTVESNWVITNK